MADGDWLYRCEEVSREAGTVTLRFEGELDLSVADQVRVDLERHLEGASRLRLDFAGVGFVDSRAINALLAVARAAPGGGGAVVLLDPQPQVRRALDILGLSDVFGLPPAPGGGGV